MAFGSPLDCSSGRSRFIKYPTDLLKRFLSFIPNMPHFFNFSMKAIANSTLGFVKKNYKVSIISTLSHLFHTRYPLTGHLSGSSFPYKLAYVLHAPQPTLITTSNLTAWIIFSNRMAARLPILTFKVAYVHWSRLLRHRIPQLLFTWFCSIDHGAKPSWLRTATATPAAGLRPWKWRALR